MEIGGKYVLREVIASGSYGKVYRSYPYAIKQLRIPMTNNPRTLESFKKNLDNQITILTQLNHPNVVKLYEIIYQNNSIYIVMELCDSDLKEICEKMLIGEKKAYGVMQQIIQGCKQLVKSGIVHRDLKPANILIHNGLYKLADFGMAKFVREGDQENLLLSHVGTPYYMSPQILQRTQYTRKCDIWSLGVIFYELIFGHLPWVGKNEYALLNNIMSTPLRFPSYVSLQTKDLLEKMLAITECNRISWNELFKVMELQKMRDASLETLTFHRNIIHQMITVETEHFSKIQFKASFKSLNHQQKTKVIQLVEGLFREEEVQIIRQFAKNL